MSANNAKLQSFKASWQFDRGLSLDMLNSLSDSELLWSPGAGVGAFWKQFRHVGRVQENYIEAVRSGKVKFSSEGSGYDGGASGAALAQYLKRLDQELMHEVDNLDFSREIDWFGEPVNALVHLFRMSSHEVLHHGQWIVYLKLMGKKFPDSWSIWGLA